ncbi:MAG: MGMT family protein [Serratia symbiotica]|nr:MGMT family protein [Serratia symbiotica]
MHPVAPSFSQRVFHVVAAIPYGKITTYGEVARLAESPRAACQVGGVLRRLPEGSTLPWHRVMNRHGQISQQCEDCQRQRQALVEEGIIFRTHSTVDFQLYGWYPNKIAFGRNVEAINSRIYQQS